MFSNIIVLAQQTAAPAAGAAQTAAGGSGLLGMMPIFVLFGVMIFLMWRSQKKQAKERQEMLASIKAGDKIITTGGIKGTIEKVKDDSYLLKIADKVTIEIVHAAVGRVLGKDNKKDNNE